MKSTFLQVMSILFIVFGVISIIVSIMGIGGYAVIGALVGRSFMILGIISLATSVIWLVAGIVGITSFRDQRKAAGCLVWAIIIIVLDIISIIAMFSTGFMAVLNEVSYYISGYTVSPFSMVMQFVLPVLYFIAAFKFVRKR